MKHITNHHQAVRHRSIWPIVAMSLMLIATSCGSSPTEVAGTSSEADPTTAPQPEATSEPPAEPAPEPTAQPDAAPETESGDTAESEGRTLASEGDGEDSEAEPKPPTEIEVGEADWTGLTEWSLGALGGLTFGVPQDHVVHHDGDMVIVRTPFDQNTGRYDPSMIVALTAQTGSGDTLTSIEQFTTSAVTGVGTAEPTNESLTLFGQELQGWRFTMNDGQKIGAHYLYSAYPTGVAGPSAWQPFPLAELFLAEVPEGILVVGVTARSEDDLAVAKEIFDRVTPTLTLARSLENPLPPATGIGSSEPAPPPEPAPKPEGWPSLLTGVNKRIDEGGDFTTTMLSSAMSFTLPDGWWVQLNFPSWFVLSADESFGPGDRGIVFRTGVDALLPVARGSAAGVPIPFDVETLVTSPPSNLEVVETEEVAVGGATGIRLRLQIASDASCGETDPCEYLITTIYPFPPASMRKGYVYDLWYLEGDLSEPVLILALTPSDRWLATSQGLIDTITFDVTE